LPQGKGEIMHMIIKFALQQVINDHSCSVGAVVIFQQMLSLLIPCLFLNHVSLACLSPR